jgi:hypothetical protein
MNGSKAWRSLSVNKPCTFQESFCILLDIALKDGRNRVENPHLPFNMSQATVQVGDLLTVAIELAPGEQDHGREQAAERRHQQTERGRGEVHRATYVALRMPSVGS